MKTKKLTEAQTTSLTLLGHQGSANFYDLLHAGANGSTTTTLTKQGLIELTIDKAGAKTWSITEAGREALAAGRYPITP